MIPFKKILCPTDFSQPSYEALKVASELALLFSAEICVVNAISPILVPAAMMDYAAFNFDLYDKEMEESSRKSLEEAIEQMVSKGVRVNQITVHGKAAETILRVAEEENADLIVIATRGRTGLQHMLFGSVAEKIVRLAKCTVLTVKAPPQEMEIEQAA